MGFKGSVESFSLADVFQNLAMNQQTGTLRVYTGTGQEKLVHFDKGQVHFLAPAPGKPLLTPEIFFARGLVSRQQVDDAIVRQNESGKPIGTCMVDLAFLTEEQFAEVTAHQIEEEIYDLFSWEKAQFEFNDGPANAEHFKDQPTVRGSSLPISHLIMEAARRVDEWDRLRKQIPSFKEIYCMDSGLRKSIEKGEKECDPIDKRVALLADGTRDLEDLIEDSCLFKFEVMSALGQFIQSSLARPAAVQDLNAAEAECARNNLPRRRIKILERILALGGENPRVRRELAELLAKERVIDKACIHFAVLAGAELQAGHEDKAVELYAKILAIAPKHLQSHEQLGTIYARRNKKREAFVHFQELFESYRDQKHFQEARSAGMRALECDPSNADLRNGLIELLIASNQKEAASQQIEIVGDQAAKLGNVKLAADSYRRAMQFKPGNKQLKAKLADVMLSKEDRRARKRRVLVFVVAVIVLAIAGGVLAFKEHSNKSLFARAEDEAHELEDRAQKVESENGHEAHDLYVQAADKYQPVTQVFSPLMGYHKTALRKIKRLEDLAAEATKNGDRTSQQGKDKGKVDRESALSARENGDVYRARDQAEKVLTNNFASPEDKKAAEQIKKESDNVIQRFEAAWKENESDPLVTYLDANKQYDPKIEYERKSNFLTDGDFKKLPSERFNRAGVHLPLIVQTNSDAIVYLDGKQFGAVHAGGSWKDNTFRYSAGTHNFEFRKPGFKTVTVNTVELGRAIFDLRLEREPSLLIDVAALGVNDFNALSGDAAVDGDSMYVGTDSGFILEISQRDRTIVRRSETPSAGGLEKEVYGAIFPYKREGKPTRIFHCLRAGQCLVLEPEGGRLVARQTLNGGGKLTARPCVVNAPDISPSPLLAIPVDKSLVLVDCEKAAVCATIPFKATITSSPIMLTINKGNFLVACCADGKIYAYKGPAQQNVWDTMQKFTIEAQPVVLDDRLVVGDGSGQLYYFNSSADANKQAKVIGSIAADLCLVNRKIYFGTKSAEGFYCFDANTKKVWAMSEEGMGEISVAAVVSGNIVYFVTDSGRIYAHAALQDAKPAWVYKMDNGKRFCCPPRISGKRLFAFCVDGKIVGFDEESE